MKDIKNDVSVQTQSKYCVKVYPILIYGEKKGITCMKFHSRIWF